MTNFKWLRRPNDGWQCENYRCNGILIASYHHTVCSTDPEYRGEIFLPDINIKIVDGTREEVKLKIEQICNDWIDKLIDKKAERVKKK
jgi:hypothetical protein